MYDYHKLVLFLLFSTLSHCATLFPSTLVTSSGSASSTPLTALRTQDQSASQDTWNNYVEFYGSSKAYAGVLTFSTAALDARAVQSFTVQANFKGPTVSAQKWTFEFYDNVNKVWILFGDNTGVSSWIWSPITLRSGSTAFSSLVSNGQVQLRFSSASKGDDCDLDYLAIVTTESSAPAPSTPAPSSPPVGATVRPTTPTTKPATPAPTTKPATAAPTTKPATAAPVTAAPTTKPATAAPTTKPATAAPTTKPATAAPTTKPATPAPGGRICPAGQVWAPAPGTTWQWQLTGPIDTSLDVQMYDIDLFDTAASTITTLHGKGRVVICYFSTQYENWRPDASKFTSDVLGNNLDDWPGERYVDIRSSKIRQIMSERLDLAVSKGCDGVEPDNVDGYSNNNGLGLTANDQLDYNKFLANEAHKRGLSIGLKNDLAQVNALVSSFDWALNEQCNEYKECSALNPFVTAGKAVFGVEYTGSASTFCPAMVTAKFSWWLKNLNLGAGGTQCCTYASGGCAAKATYRCASYSSKRTIDGQEEYVLDEAAESPVNPPELPEAQAVEAQAVEASAASYTVVSAVAVVAAVAAMVL